MTVSPAFLASGHLKSRYRATCTNLLQPGEGRFCASSPVSKPHQPSAENRPFSGFLSLNAGCTHRDRHPRCPIRSPDEWRGRFHSQPAPRVGQTHPLAVEDYLSTRGSVRATPQRCEARCFRIAASCGGFSCRGSHRGDRIHHSAGGPT